MGTLIYFLKEAVRGFYQAKLMTFVAILSIAASLFFMSLTVIAFLNVERLLSKSTDQADMAAYIYDRVVSDDGAVDELLEKVRGLTSVRRVDFIDKDSAWNRFAELYGTEMLESVDDNPLPAHLEIYFKENARSHEDAERLADVIGNYSEIESVRYSREWIDLVERFRILFAGVAAVIAIVIIFILYFMISNTIKLTIYARKELVAHMQVVGATAFFIEMPFILEGILQGLIGGILSVLATGVLRLFLLLFFDFHIYWGPHWLPGFFIFIGVLFGWLGSAGAVRKFLV
jgi:cell division transport system permease protein